MYTQSVAVNDSVTKPLTGGGGSSAAQTWRRQQPERSSLSLPRSDQGLCAFDVCTEDPKGKPAASKSVKRRGIKLKREREDR